MVNNFRSANETLTLFPNPAINILNVKYLNQSDGKVQITLHDLSGRTIITKQENVSHNYSITVLDVSTLTKGTYFIVITDASGGKRTKTFIKS